MTRLIEWRVWALIAVALFGLNACDDSKQVAKELKPVAFHSGDECHVCGMVIGNFPGPKGEVVSEKGVHKFCSAAEMLGWWLQPENHMSNAKLYVHDMGRSTWEKPDDQYLIDATTAYYVSGTALKGAMGVVLATFSDKAAAEKLAAEQGGHVLRFEDIDQQFLQSSTAPQMSEAE